MGVHGGPKVTDDGLVFSFDPGNTKSSLRKKQSSNILPDPNNWTTGTGGISGYGANGSASEQNRLYVNDDPWGRRSVTWRTTPDATSNADGGWNTSYYSIDRSYTYRWSVWVRRYTTGTGGTFYLGLNPAPIRNDNGNTQGNPYFTYVGISGLTYNQWYLVVGHCFYEGYSGGRHPDSGWYENGVKISDKSYGNVGTQDVRWASSTTTAMHRAYHYYTTNTASGIEFAFPRLDKCDGNEPSIKQLIEIGESGGKGLISGKKLDLHNGVGFGEERKNIGYFNFDGTDDYVTAGALSGSFSSFTVAIWFYPTSVTSYENPIDCNYSYNGTTGNIGPRLEMNWSGNLTWVYSNITNSNNSYYSHSVVSSGLAANTWHCAAITYNGGTNTSTTYYNGNASGLSRSTVGSPTGFVGVMNNVTIGKGFHLGGSERIFTGRVSNVSIYNRALSASEIQQNFNATRGRYGI